MTRDNLLGTINALDQSTTFGYDDQDQLLAITNALSQIVSMAYDSDGNLTNLVDPLSRATRWTYDSNERETEATYADGLQITRGYDIVGRVNAVTNHGSGLVVGLSYDNLDRIQQVVFPDGTNVFQYSCCGLEAFTDRLGRTTSYEHDPLGRVSAVVNPLSQRTEFGYNGADQLKTLTTYVGASPRVKQFGYVSTNGTTRLAQVTTPLGKTTAYDYAFRGWLTSRVDGNNLTTHFDYDPLGRLTAVAAGGQTRLTVAQNILGLTTNVLGEHGSAAVTFDALNRPSAVVSTISGITGFSTVQYRVDYAYDAAGNLTNRVVTGLQGLANTITTRYGYDAMYRLTNLWKAMGSRLNS